LIVAFSTSSPQASVAVFEGSRLVASGEEIAPQAASGACMRLLAGFGVRLQEVELFLADLGPGSFTGVRVGVTLAKTLAFALTSPGAPTLAGSLAEGAALGRPTSASPDAGGADAFDLISPTRTVVLPSKRGEWFVRSPGSPPIRASELPNSDFVGYGPGLEPTYPHAARFEALLSKIQRVAPELLVPAYLIEPSISQPKRAYTQAADGR
jgi:tRNA threonylcarbamoyladenosine biosynthesis protein TsaB